MVPTEAVQMSVAERAGGRAEGILEQITFPSENPRLKPYLGVGCLVGEMVMLFTEGELGGEADLGKEGGVHYRYVRPQGGCGISSEGSTSRLNRSI